jgi:hypothetical protein
MLYTRVASSTTPFWCCFRLRERVQAGSDVQGHLLAQLDQQLPVQAPRTGVPAVLPPPAPESSDHRQHCRLVAEGNSTTRFFSKYTNDFQAALIVVWAVQSETLGDDGNYPTNVVWSVCCMSINIAVSILGWWRCFANNYLHWAAVCTWLLLTTQSSTQPSNCLTLRLSFTDSRFRGGWLRLQSQTRPGLVRPVHGLRPLRDAAVALEVVHDRRVSLGSRSHYSYLR